MLAPFPDGTRILVVEDDMLTARLLRARLELEGLVVLEARNGREALEILRQGPVDLVSTDLTMPAMDGYRLIREIRELPPPMGRVPMLVLSVNQAEEDIVRCLAAGADDYMTKPLSPQIYVQKLRRLHAQVRR